MEFLRNKTLGSLSKTFVYSQWGISTNHKIFFQKRHGLSAGNSGPQNGVPSPGNDRAGDDSDDESLSPKSSRWATAVGVSSWRSRSYRVPTWAHVTCRSGHGTRFQAQSSQNLRKTLLLCETHDVLDYLFWNITNPSWIEILNVFPFLYNNPFPLIPNVPPKW